MHRTMPAFQARLDMDPPRNLLPFRTFGPGPCDLSCSSRPHGERGASMGVMPVAQSTQLGPVTAVLRYPVKSLAGEALERATIDGRGLVGDRLWCVRDPDGKLGSGKSTRRFRKMEGLLDLVATYDGDVPVIGYPDGRTLRGDDPDVHAALSRHVGRA